MVHGSKIKNYFKSCSNRAYFVQKNLFIIFPKTVLVHLPPPTQKKGLKWYFFTKILILTLLEYENIPQTYYIFNFGLILFTICHWLFSCCLFGSSSYHLRKNWKKPLKNRPKIYWSGTEMQAYLINERWHQFLILSCLFVIFPRIK